MQLAAEKGITEYACPAGGCLLADKIYGRKLRELLQNNPAAGLAEMRLLKYGRHFRLSDGSKIIVGRDEQENGTLERLGHDQIKLQVVGGLGPITLAAANVSAEIKRLAASITARYSQRKENGVFTIRCWNNGNEELLEVEPIADAQISQWRVE
jgi:hypothetical protein